MVGLPPPRFVGDPMNKANLLLRKVYTVSKNIIHHDYFYKTLFVKLQD